MLFRMDIVHDIVIPALLVKSRDNMNDIADIAGLRAIDVSADVKPAAEAAMCSVCHGESSGYIEPVLGQNHVGTGHALNRYCHNISRIYLEIIE